MHPGRTAQILAGMKTVIAILALALAPGAARHEPAPLAAGTEEQCAVALGYVQTILAKVANRNIVFTDQPEFVPSLPTRAEWYDSTAKQWVPAPAAELVASASAESAVATCGSVQAWLRGKGIRYGEAAVESATRGIPWNGTYRAVILGLSLPAISADHQEAVMVTSSYSGPLGGGGNMLHLKRTPEGVWKQAATVGLYIS